MALLTLKFDGREDKGLHAPSRKMLASRQGLTPASSINPAKAIAIAALTAMMFGLLLVGCATQPARTFQSVDGGWPHMGWTTAD